MDKLRYYCDNQRHLVCKPYSVKNLHLMATALNINICWYHAGSKPHYDIPKNRINEIMQKCTIVRPREILEIIKNNQNDYIKRNHWEAK